MEMLSLYTNKNIVNFTSTIIALLQDIPFIKIHGSNNKYSDIHFVRKSNHEPV